MKQKYSFFAHTLLEMVNFPGLGPIAAILVSWGYISLRILREIIKTQNGIRGKFNMQKLNADLKKYCIGFPQLNNQYGC